MLATTLHRPTVKEVKTGAPDPQHSPLALAWSRVLGGRRSRPRCSSSRLAQFCSELSRSQGLVMEAVRSTVVFPKLSSVRTNLSRFRCQGSPSNTHTPRRVWSAMHHNVSGTFTRLCGPPCPSISKWRKQIKALLECLVSRDCLLGCAQKCSSLGS